jgi:hypothetical protein
LCSIILVLVGIVKLLGKFLSNIKLHVFQMPLSKKLKANAMAALFKTQSGFTVKRKGSTSSLMVSGK